MKDISQFTIFRNPSTNQKRQSEAFDLMPFLLRVIRFMELTDVQFGQDPPDFIFYHQDRTIGVELTDLNPRTFEKHGHLQRAEFKSFEEEATEKSSTDEVFNWGKFSLRESVEAFSATLKNKQNKATPWFNNFPERWLLMRVTNGSPFGEILNGKQQTALGMENEVADYFAKLTHTIYSICQKTAPFDCVILFHKSENDSEMLLFSSN